MKYNPQYRSHDMFEPQQFLSGLSKQNRWGKFGDYLPWNSIEREYNKCLRDCHNGAGKKRTYGGWRIDKEACGEPEQ